VIYVQRPGDIYEPSVGDFLGDMTDELDGGHITEFVSLGPKQYTYKGVSKNGAKITECKIRGITLNSEAVTKLNFLSMKRLVHQFLTDRSREPIVVTSSCLRRTRGHEIMTRIVTKTYSVCYDKCRVLPSGQTVPFGYHV
jgi:hypothetical protein